MNKIVLVVLMSVLLTGCGFDSDENCSTPQLKEVGERMTVCMKYFNDDDLYSKMRCWNNAVRYSCSMLDERWNNLLDRHNITRDKL